MTGAVNDLAFDCFKNRHQTGVIMTNKFNCTIVRAIVVIIIIINCVITIVFVLVIIITDYNQKTSKARPKCT